MSEPNPIFRDLSPALVARMERQRAFVSDLAKRHGLKSVAGTAADFDLIQEILSRKLLEKDETWELQALGVVFGDALMSEEPKLHWIEVTDAWGTAPTAVYGDSTLRLNAVTMISKRVENGNEGPFVVTLADTVLRLAREKGPMADKR